MASIKDNIKTNGMVEEAGRTIDSTLSSLEDLRGDIRSSMSNSSVTGSFTSIIISIVFMIISIIIFALNVNKSIGLSLFYIITFLALCVVMVVDEYVHYKYSSTFTSLLRRVDGLITNLRSKRDGMNLVVVDIRNGVKNLSRGVSVDNEMEEIRRALGSINVVTGTTIPTAKIILYYTSFITTYLFGAYVLYLPAFSIVSHILDGKFYDGAVDVFLKILYVIGLIVVIVLARFVYSMLDNDVRNWSMIAILASPFVFFLLILIVAIVIFLLWSIVLILIEVLKVVFIIAIVLGLLYCSSQA